MDEATPTEPATVKVAVTIDAEMTLSGFNDLLTAILHHTPASGALTVEVKGH